MSHAQPTCPTNSNEVLVTSLWFSKNFIGHHFGFTLTRAVTLQRAGMDTINAIWNPQTQDLLSWNQAQAKFSLKPDEEGAYPNILDYIPYSWQILLTRLRGDTLLGEYMGVFSLPKDQLPAIIILTARGFTPSITNHNHSILPPSNLHPTTPYYLHLTTPCSHEGLAPRCYYPTQKP